MQGGGLQVFIKVSRSILTLKYFEVRYLNLLCYTGHKSYLYASAWEDLASELEPNEVYVYARDPRLAAWDDMLGYLNLI